MPDDLRWSNAIVIEIQCIITVTCLNHPETIPLPRPQSMEKLLSTKLVLGAKMVGDCCLRRSTDPPDKEPQSCATCCVGS